MVATVYKTDLVFMRIYIKAEPAPLEGAGYMYMYLFVCVSMNID